MKTLGVVRISLAIAGLVILQHTAIGQSVDGSSGSADFKAPLPSTESYTTPEVIYARPGARVKVKSYLLYSVGPLAVAGSGLVAANGQEYNSPPEWGQGSEGFGKRFASAYGIDAVGATTGFALAEVFRQDILYYRCDCKGVLPRVAHAVASTLTARRGTNGHRVFSIPLLVAPYAGTMSAVYGWYPDRFGAMDGLRMGNYYVLGSAAENIVLEFIQSGSRWLRSRKHFTTQDETPPPALNP